MRGGLIFYVDTSFMFSMGVEFESREELLPLKPCLSTLALHDFTSGRHKKKKKKSKRNEKIKNVNSTCKKVCRIVACGICFQQDYDVQRGVASVKVHARGVGEDDGERAIAGKGGRCRGGGVGGGRNHVPRTVR